MSDRNTPAETVDRTESVTNPVSMGKKPGTSARSAEGGLPGTAPRAGAPFVPGAAARVPPPSVPLMFLAAAGVGLCAFGLAVWFAADRIVQMPIHTGAVSAVHVGVLAFLTTAVLGALHQFVPVVSRQALRSVAVARVTFVAMLITAWMLPSGFAHGPESLVAGGAVFGSVTVALAAWNLSGPLSSRDGGGVPLQGLRFSVFYFVVTVTFGVVYAFDRQEAWFPLLPNRVMAHAHMGLLGWLGLTYVAVAEKLWPMFLLAHRPSDRSGAWAVGLIAGGAPLLVTGLLFSWPMVGWPGGAAVVAGLGCHLASLASSVKHRRRPLELLHGFLFVSAAFLVIAVLLGTAAVMLDLTLADRTRLVSAEVASLMAWLGLAIIGHAHKIVPFIAYSSMRAKGMNKGPTGKALMFADLFNLQAARATLVLAASGYSLAVSGILLESVPTVGVGGVLLSATGILALANLGLGPGRAKRRIPKDASQRPDTAGPGEAAAAQAAPGAGSIPDAMSRTGGR